MNKITNGLNVDIPILLIFPDLSKIDIDLKAGDSIDTEAMQVKLNDSFEVIGDELTTIGNEIIHNISDSTKSVIITDNRELLYRSVQYIYVSIIDIVDEQPNEEYNYTPSDYLKYFLVVLFLVLLIIVVIYGGMVVWNYVKVGKVTFV